MVSVSFFSSVSLQISRLRSKTGGRAESSTRGPDLSAQSPTAWTNPPSNLLNPAKAQANKQAQTQGTGQDPGKRIADIQSELKQLLKRMQRAALMGDKRAAAAIAREAARLAKELSKAVKEAAADGQSVGSEADMPFMVALNPISTTQGETSPAGPGNDSPAGSAASAASQPMHAEVSLTSPELGQGSLSDGLLQEVSKAVVMLRSIIALAKMTIERKDTAPGSRKEDPHTAKDLDKETTAAAKDVDDAIASIEKAAGPSSATPQAGLTLHFSTEG